MDGLVYAVKKFARMWNVFQKIEIAVSFVRLPVCRSGCLHVCTVCLSVFTYRFEGCPEEVHVEFFEFGARQTLREILAIEKRFDLQFYLVS